VGKQWGEQDMGYFWPRDVTICKSCVPHIKDDVLVAASEIRLCDYAVDPVFTMVADESQTLSAMHERWQDHEMDSGDESSGKLNAPQTCILGRSIDDFAPAVALLTDHEEMVIALVHPLVQVYTIPRTGQLAYVGHICNFRQKVAKFLNSLPIPKNDFPFVMVRPRRFANRPTTKAPFKINVQKIRDAFRWLKENNPYYYNVDWIESRTADWLDEEIPVGTSRSEDILTGQALPVSSEVFRVWMQESACQRASGEVGFSIGARLLALLEEEREDEDVDLWNVVRAFAARVTGVNFMRAAAALSDHIVAALLHANDAIDTGIPPSVEQESLVSFIGDMPEEDLTDDLTMLYSELHTMRVLVKDGDDDTISAGSVSAMPTDENVSLRTDALDGLNKLVQDRFGTLVGDDLDGAENLNDPASPTGEGDIDTTHQDSQALPATKSSKFPRVDPPEVEDQVGQVIREDTPGYIAQAFPKLFPHGVVDYHTPRGSLGKLLKFEEWGRYVMMWHDGRFARHTRFRYWLLDTSLRLMTPGMQRTFFKTREAACQYTLEDLEDKQTRRNLVQQMSTATNQLPGSVGERRKMRQQLEAMVYQIEAETADQGENAGAGRIPAGFCTLTCPVYKWTQLRDTILKSYPSGQEDDPKARDYFEKWKLLPPGSARDMEMKRTFYELAVVNPAIVEWYCSLKLEMGIHLLKRLLTEAMQSPTMPGLGLLYLGKHENR
jgi:hypothetical protein